MDLPNHEENKDNKCSGGVLQSLKLRSCVWGKGGSAAKVLKDQSNYDDNQQQCSENCCDWDDIDTLIKNKQRAEVGDEPPRRRIGLLLIIYLFSCPVLELQHACCYCKVRNVRDTHYPGN